VVHPLAYFSGALGLMGWSLNVLSLYVRFSWGGAGGFVAPIVKQQHHYQQQQQAWINDQMDIEMCQRLNHVSKMTLACTQASESGQAGKAVT